MMTRNREIARAVRRTLLLGALAATSASLPLYAQTQTAPTASDENNVPELSTVTVTGSRIQVPNQTSISPVTAITADELVNTGRTRVEDVLNTLPQVFGSQNSGVSNGSNGTSLVNLRDLDSKRTLVLVDGRRLGPGDPTGGFARNSYGADVNMIPSQLIERVDVLTGGASSTYGADAVAGVVNFVINNHFEGVKINTSYGYYDHSNNNAVRGILAGGDPPVTVPDSIHEGFQKDVNVIIGLNTPDSKGNATFYATYRNIAPILQGPYDYSGCTLNSGQTFSCGGSSTTGPPTSLGRAQQIINNPDGTVSRGPNQSIGPGGTLSPFANANLYNYGALNYYQRPDERWTAGAFSHYEFNEHADTYGEFMFMRDTTTSQIAPSGAFSAGNVLSADGTGALLVNCTNPFLSATEHNQWCNGTQNADGNAELVIGRRNIEGGPRQQELTHTDWRVVLGTRGEINDAWKYDVYAQQGEVQFQSTYLNELSWQNIQDALQVGGTAANPVCLSGNPACIPWNIFGTGLPSKASAAALQIPLLQIGSVTERVADANFTGDLGKYGIKLPTAGSGLQVNVGGEYRQEKSNFQPDIAYVQGLGAGQGGPTLPIQGGYNVREGFFEARLPVLEDQFLAKSLSVETGYRYSDYSLNFQTNTYKFGMEWAPTEDVRLRGSFQRAVRVPNVGELYNPVSVGLDGVTDLCSGAAPSLSLAQCMRQGVTAQQYGQVDQNPAAQYNGQIGGNPDLKPETAITKSIGVSFTPSFLEGLRITVDYFDIDIQNAIQNPNADFTMILCSLTGASNLCNRIHRDATGSLDGGPDGYVDDTLVNIGSLKTRGFDLDSAYRVVLPQNLGKLNFSMVGTYTSRYVTEPQPGASYDCAGYFGGICQAPLPKWRHTFTTNYQTPIKGLDVSLAWRYLDSVKLDAFAPGLSFLQNTPYVNPTDLRLSSRSYIDGSISYQYDKYNVRFGVNNMLDKDPPINGATTCPSGPCNGNTWPTVYDVTGRYMYVSLTAEF